MTATSLTRPGERDRLRSKLGQIDWSFVGLLCVVAGTGALMLFSVGGGSWTPWAGNHLVRFGILLVVAGTTSLRVLKKVVDNVGDIVAPSK